MSAPAQGRFVWTVNRRLAAAALVLGALAMAGRPEPGHRVTIDTQQLATIVAGEVDHVTPAELADWIIRGAGNYRLVDLRDAASFARYHIPTAENVPLAELPDHGLARNERIILYSDGGIHAAQAWMLLAAQGYHGATTLLGGLDAWQDEVLYPAAPANPAPREAASFERAVQVARFFGGQPRATAASPVAGAGSLMAPALPQPAAPPPPPSGKPVRTAKAPKEGC